MTISKSQASLARRLANEVPDIDTTLPYWARRTNPIVRRQLGMYWRVFPPQVGPLAKWTIILSIAVAATIPYPLIFVFILTFLLAAATMLPFAFYLYVRALGLVISDAASSLVDEYKNETMTLLRATPISTTEIILSKIAASVWRRVDDLDQVLSFGVALGMPTIVMFYLGIWPPDEAPFVAQGLTVIMFVSSLIRLPLEMFMVASIGALMGVITHVKSTAFLSSAVIVFFYFLILNLVRLLTLSWPVQLFVDSILPIVLPLVVMWFCIQLTIKLILSD